MDIPTGTKTGRRQPPPGADCTKEWLDNNPWRLTTGCNEWDSRRLFMQLNDWLLDPPPAYSVSVKLNSSAFARSDEAASIPKGWCLGRNAGTAAQWLHSESQIGETRLGRVGDRHSRGLHQRVKPSRESPVLRYLEWVYGGELGSDRLTRVVVTWGQERRSRLRLRDSLEFGPSRRRGSLAPRQIHLVDFRAMLRPDALDAGLKQKAPAYKPGLFPCGAAVGAKKTLDGSGNNEPQGFYSPA